MKLLKWIGIAVVVLLLLLVGAAVILPLVVDPNDHKERITSLVQAQTGRDFSIGGDIEWTVFPWIGVGLSDLTLGNAEGFGGPHLAKVDGARVSVKLMPLLRRQLEVSGVTLDGLDLNLETNAGGISNWADLLGQDSAEGSDQSGVGQLQVGFVALTDSRVNWRQPGQAVTIDQINVKTGPISKAGAIDVDYQLRLVSDDLKLDAVLSGAAAVHNALADEPLKALVEQLELNGIADTISFDLRGSDIVADLGTELVQIGQLTVSGKADQLPYEATLDGASLNLASDSADLPKVLIQTGKASANLVAKATELSGNMVVNGRVEVPQLNPRELFAALGIASPATTDSAALSQLNASADFRYGADQARLTNIKARLDDTTLEGQVDLSSIEQLAATFDLRLDQIDLDRYLPPAGDSGSAEPPGAAAEPNFGNLNGRVRIAQATVAKAELTDLDLTIRSTPNGLSIDETASIYEGQSRGAVRLNRDGRLRINNRVGGVQATPLLKAFTDSELLSGIGDLQLDLEIGNAFADNPVGTLNGSVAFELSDGAILGFNVFSMLRQASAKLGLDTTASTAASEQTDFSKFVFSANVVDGVLQTNDFDLRSPYLRAAGSGSINLVDLSLDYQLRPTLVKTPEGQGGAGLDKLQGVAIPLGLGGTVLEPKLRLDPQALLMAWQGQRIEAEKEKLESAIDEKKDELVGRLFGGGDDAEEAEEGASGASGDEGDAAETEPAEQSSEDKVKDRLRGLLGKKLGGDDDNDDGDG